ncbi:hypothetical protein [Nonomuraea sp. B19D2]|uniref:hypothetical protein n=1 Tax=Nonomuraea sp. B19D2 TaxID=3159561 RepID=UPI0032DA8CD4
MSGRHAVIIPGGSYGPLAGLLAYVGETAARRGAHLELISWTPPPGRPLDERLPWVLGQVTTAVEAFLDTVVWR